MDLTEFSALKDRETTLAETVLVEFAARPVKNLVERIETRICERLEAHTAQFLHQDVIDLSPRDCALIRQFTRFLQKQIKERSV